MADVILSINAGSSSVKFGLHRAGSTAWPSMMASGQIKNSDGGIRLEARDADGGTALNEAVAGAGPDAAYERLLAWSEDLARPNRLAAVGHRVVHGGSAFTGPVRLTAEAIAAIEDLTPLAPLHQPLGLRPVHAVAGLRPDLRQTASFDTAFHSTIAPDAARYALPRRLETEGIRKYGFHGLSYDYIAHRLEQRWPGTAAKKTVVAHLGAGVSLCALENGKSADTTMGFSVLDGAVMATRCGSLDPGVILYLLKAKGFTPEAIEHLLYYKSGLLGVSELSGDIRELLKADTTQAREAVALFVRSIARQVAVMATSLGGLDRLVFTGGVGENQPGIRDAICHHLVWLGLAVDPDQNSATAERINAVRSRVEILIVPTDEEAVIARDAAMLLAS
ncbi:MAG TPA: acetate/propionate family kinase [Aurantimonas coralicida]|uniref:Acetate kinase n=2 Tax=root TaxID=1 RepID=A0A9C9TIU4_9HYPH|nr:acetate/propionate family kinase [Aurantimonas coralicida]HEU02732.1 acetate/propionate family kinase [Aurantimonas coralicida]